MLQVRRDFDLAQESLGAEDRAELRLEDFECDASVVAQITRQENRRHSADADLALDVVSALEAGVQLRERIHGRYAIGRTMPRLAVSVQLHASPLTTRYRPR